MADPLYAAAEQLAPTRAGTNFFSPSEGANIISRYASAGVAGEGARELGDAASRLASTRFERAAQRRQLTAWDRDEQEYREKQDYKVQRGEFLQSISSLDPYSPDYEQTRSELMASLPMEAQKDDAVASIIAAKDRLFQNGIDEVERLDTEKRSLERQRTLMQERAAMSARLGVLTAEDWSEIPIDPATGGKDMTVALQRAAVKEQSAKAAKEDTKAKMEQADREAKLRKEADDKAVKRLESTITDTAAFPPQLPMVIRSRSKKPTSEDLRTDPELVAAARWDKDQLNSELGAARGRTMDDYVNLVVTGLTKEGRAKREELWKYANQQEPAAPAAPAPAAPTTQRPKAPEGWRIGATYKDPKGNRVKVLEDGTLQRVN